MLDNCESNNNRSLSDITRSRLFPDKDTFKFIMFAIRINQCIEAHFPLFNPQENVIARCNAKLDRLSLDQLADLIIESKKEDWIKTPYFFKIASERLLKLKFPQFYV